VSVIRQTMETRSSVATIGSRIPNSADFKIFFLAIGPKFSVINLAFFQSILKVMKTP